LDGDKPELSPVAGNAAFHLKDSFDLKTDLVVYDRRFSEPFFTHDVSMYQRRA
jgi:hypothetical protein